MRKWTMAGSQLRGPGSPPPKLSGLADDDDEEEKEVRPKPRAPGNRTTAPHPVPIFDDIPNEATVVAAMPYFAEAGAISAAVTSHAKGAMDVGGGGPRQQKPRPMDLPEPSITVDAALLAEMTSALFDDENAPPTISRPIQQQPHPAAGPARPVLPSGPAWQRPAPWPSYGEAFAPESTRILDSAQNLIPGPLSGKHAVVRTSRPLPTLDSGEGGQEATRIISTLNLSERHEARARKTEAQAQIGIDELTLPPIANKEPGGSKNSSGKVEAQSRRGPQMKNPVKQVKAKSRIKAAPLDPQRLLVQQEAAERRASESLVGIGVNFHGLGDSAPDGAQEHTMIGRFLGLVGISAAGPGGPAQVGVGKDPAQETWEAAQEAAILDGLNPQYLRDAIAAGDLRLLHHGRDHLVESDSRAILVLEGQLALGSFKKDVLERERKALRAFHPGDKKGEKREHNRRLEVGPVIRLASSNLGVFLEGDLVNLDPQQLTQTGAPGPQGESLGIYAVTPVKLLSISGARLEAWRRTYQFFGDRLRRATDAARGRLAANSGARSLVADFYVRNGMSVALTLRVREVDKCIECYACEQACEERYGVKRLSLKGKVLGGLDFVDCCRSCADQRCIDPCAYDAIKFDDQKKEIIIVEEACTGCSMCSLACPYDAIEMHDLDQKPLLKLRLSKEDKLGFGDAKPRKAQLRRIASKCDHCISYEDQACITACPTNALLEIAPESIFTERTASMADAALGGFDATSMFDPSQLFNPQKFFSGLKVGDDQARSADRPLRTGWLWVIGLCGFIACLGEILLRRFLPTASLLFYYQTHGGGLDPDVALQNIDYRPGDNFAVWIGWVGTVLMFSSTLYSARKWLPPLRRLGSQRSWFDYHVFSGAVGPLFVLLHTAAKLDNWVSLAVWSMIATALSGIVGRYLSTELPDLANQAALHVLELERRMAELRNRHAGISIADRYFEMLRKRYARVNAPGRSRLSAVLLTFAVLLRDDLTRPLRALRLRRRLTGVKDRAARREVARLTTKLALVERRRVLLPHLEPIFKEWKTVHVPFALIMTILVAIHVFDQLQH